MHPGRDRGQRERNVRAVRCRDRDEIEAETSIPQLRYIVDDANARVSLRGRTLSVAVTRDDRRQLQPRRGRDEWRVECRATETVADDPDAECRMGRSRHVSGA